MSHVTALPTQTQATHRREGWGLWWRWVLAVVGGELIGFAVPRVVGGVLMGVVVGAITGAVLVWLLRIGASSAKQFSSTD